MAAIEDALYSMHPPPQLREKKMQVLALGLSRSGTDSLCKALQTLGYDKVWHGFDLPAFPDNFERWVKLKRKKWKTGPRFRVSDSSTTPGDTDITRADFDDILGNYEAMTDMPSFMFASQLIAAYPEARVILNTRSNEDAWHRSVTESFKDINMGFGFWFWLYSFFDRESYWSRLYWDECWDAWFQGSTAGNGKWVRREYHAMLKGSVASNRMLEWTVEQGWDPLCNFLQKPIPTEEFPNGNAPTELIQRVMAFTVARDARARRNLLAVSSFVLVLVGAVILKIVV